MTNDALKSFSTRRTAQSERATSDQVLNSAGGYTFALDTWAQLDRFLMLGTSGGTYYTSATELTKTNADNLLTALAEDGLRFVERVAVISESGRAPKANPALFALAVACSLGNDETRRAAFEALPRVVRIGTHMFLFAGYVEQFRGWGRGLRKAVAKWYERDLDDVTYQVLKYRARAGWSHRDLLRLAHPRAVGGYPREVLFEWICGRPTDAMRPALLDGFIKANEVGADVPALIREYGLSWEMLPDEALTVRATWDALLDWGMPQTALIRQLPRLTNLGLLGKGKGARTAEVATQLQNATRLKRGRVHPVNMLIAQRTYASGHSMRGSTSWTPVRQIVDALDAGFYAAFGAVEPTGKRMLLALDVSGSMGSQIADLPITCREAAAALALVTASVETDCTIVGFTSAGGRGWTPGNTALTELSISPRQRLDDAVHAVSVLAFGATDCALPFTESQRRGWEFDAVSVYTDNETWAGSVHPHQALRDYRAATGIATRSIVVGMTSTGFSIADPLDPGSLDVVGFDSAVPNLISDFARGNV